MEVQTRDRPMTSGEESLAKGGESKATDPVQERSDVQNVSDSHQHKKRMMEPGQPTNNESIKNEHNDVQDIQCKKNLI